MNDDACTHLDTADVTPNIDGTEVLERAKARGEAIRQKEGLASAPPKIEQLPAFPIGALPLSVADFIRAAVENIQASADMVGPCVLGALETACRGRYPVRLPNGHIERPCLYIAPVAPPSERKSSVIEVVMKPLTSYEIQYNAAHSGEVEQSQSDRRILEERKTTLEKEAAKAKTEDSREKARRELAEVNEEIAAFDPVKPLRLFGGDVTPEKLADLLYAQNETFALVSAEGGGLFDNIGRYCEKGGMDIYLNGYSGDVVHVDRKSGTAVLLKCPTLNIVALCQPIVIENLFGDKEKAGRGLLSRILFVKCQSLVGRRKPVSRPIEPVTKRRYEDLCLSMLAAENGGELTFDDDGYKVYCRFFEEVEPLLTPDSGELSLMGDWAGKVCGTMTRLAGLIHCVNAFERGQNPAGTPITEEEAESAVILARFFLAHAKAVYIEQIEPQSEKDARYLLRRIMGESPISQRDLIRKTQGYRRGNFAIDDTLKLLEERGHIRIEKIPSGTKPKILIHLLE
ncbi:MAG: DUF3987 domain-containing protein [Synergistaceae bacterium]|jgi:hypothetical protein|nr:DUF3987 domain-containing protein [Synergistaceae bacterium]